MNSFTHAALLVVGAIFLLAAAIGVLRLPDLYTRMQAATKAATLGISCIFLAVALHMADFGVAIRVFFTVVFFFLTAPVAAHMIGRAAYFIGVPLWKGTMVDELSGRYDHRTHTLSSGPTTGGSEQRTAAAIHPSTDT
jgi:multicomponent Na+:H+ antiporter subunit G